MAKKHIQQAITMSEEKPDEFRLARALIVLGDIYFKLMKWEQALSYYKKSMNLSKKHCYKERQLSSLTRAARCYDILNRNDELILSMKEILEIQNNLKITREEEIYDNL
jgi:tetratricopeptide (TPR) repeat protein